jgi:hypothetical protein
MTGIGVAVSQMGKMRLHNAKDPRISAVNRTPIEEYCLAWQDSLAWSCLISGRLRDCPNLICVRAPVQIHVVSG